MKNTTARVVVAVMLLSMIVSLFTGCFLKNNIADGPSMVNYPGLLLHAMLGDWKGDDDNYSITFWDDYTFSLRDSDAPLLVNAKLTLYTASANTDEYSEFDISPNVFPDGDGGFVEIIKASHENGAVTLELQAEDGTKSTITFYRATENTDGPEILDGSGMYHYGRVLDEAITGCWCSADGRLMLDFDGKWADFTVDGVQLASKDDGYFAEHSFSGEADLNERCELYPTGNYMDDTDDPPLIINEMWYQAEHIYMSVTWPDGKTDEIMFNEAVF